MVVLVFSTGAAYADAGQYIGTAHVSAPWGKHPHDSDGRVPEYFVRRIPGSESIVGQASYTQYSGGRVVYTIRYERGWWNRHPNCRDSERAHERGHARGFNHYESTPERNPAYYAIIQC